MKLGLKILLLSSMICSAFPAFAGSMIIGSFGTEGSALQSMPKADSAIMAAALFDGMGVGVVGRKKIIETNDGQIACEEPRQGIHTKTASCEFAFLTKIAKLAGKPMLARVSFGGEIAERLMFILPDRTNGRTGARISAAGNVQCTRVARPKAPAICVLNDVIVIVQ